jgi:lactate 2-monooxygenase
VSEPDAADQSFGDYYHGIYARGMLANELPKLPVSWSELERAAEQAMDPRAAAYVFGAAGTEDTMRANIEAFRRWRIVPRFMRPVGDRSLRTEVLETVMPAPVMLAPIGVQTLVHPDGERATARAAASLGLPMVVSTAAATSLEEIAKAAGDGPRWFQLYWPSDDELTTSLVRRAEDAGYGALVVTVDNYIPGWKPRDLKHAYMPFLEGIGIAQFTADPVFRAALEKSPEEDIGAAVGHYLDVFVNPNQTWDRLAWLRETTSLPILLKGILHVDDAREALRRGIDGLVVSNHGGRQVDGEIAALDALGPIADAVGDEMAVLFDSGIRSGADAVKALALGADAVLLGRPYLWGLALDGQAGVETVLRMLLAELDLTMVLTGNMSLDDLDRATLVHA